MRLMQGYSSSRLLCYTQLLFLLHLFLCSHLSIFSQKFYHFSMDSSSESGPLKSLVVFRSSYNPELVRSVHVYQLDRGFERMVEREYLFNKRREYEETKSKKVLTLHKFDVSAQHVGLVNGVWVCIFVFRRDIYVAELPDDLLISRNPKLASIPSLSDDLDVVSGNCFKKNDSTPVLPLLIPPSSFIRRARRTPRVPMFDLNSLPPECGNEEINPTAAGLVDKKQKRATTEDVARLALVDLAKYFDLPIIEASKNLKVGLTVLKKKCREFGIPRWPHRKIKSLDGLIYNLQEEVKQQQEEDKAAAMAVAKRQMLIEREKESIERKPFLDIQTETKKFRQDIFKRRHRARVLENRSRTLPLF